MTLRVHPDGMGHLSDAMFRASRDAGLVERHIRENAALAPRGEGMILTLMGLHEKAYPWGQQAARQMSTLSNGVGSGVAAAAKMYRHTDHDAAAELDGSYAPVQLPEMMTKRPGVPPWFVGPVGAIPPPSKFPDSRNVEGVLNQSLVFDKPDFSAKFNWLTDTLSPSAVVRNIVQALFHKDIFEWFLKDISGDWDGLYNCGTRFFQAADAVRALSGNMLNHASRLPTVWGGNAADACELYMLQLDTATNSQAAMYEHYGSAYHEAANGAWAQFELAGTFLSDALDALVAVGVAIGAAGVTSETVIGAIGGSAVAGFYAWRAWKMYRDCTEIMDSTQKLLDRIVKSGDAIRSGGKLLLAKRPDVLPFPGAPYHHPGV